jgi:hypothetical protein
MDTAGWFEPCQRWHGFEECIEKQQKQQQQQCSQLFMFDFVDGTYQSHL